jgi:predicted transglutaminase-like cysteine proteinase
MPDYNKDVSAFKKWVPVRNWLVSKPIPASGVSSIPAACDQVNRQVNTGFIYMRDGLSDTWYTPDQFVKAKGGDCEDFCIYKMHKLSQMGVPLSKMEIVLCIVKKSREYHAALRVFSGVYQYILDNQNKLLWNKDSFNGRYAPIFAISTLGWRICTN